MRQHGSGLWFPPLLLLSKPAPSTPHKYILDLDLHVECISFVGDDGFGAFGSAPAPAPAPATKPTPSAPQPAPLSSQNKPSTSQPSSKLWADTLSTGIVDLNLKPSEHSFRHKRLFEVLSRSVFNKEVCWFHGMEITASLLDACVCFLLKFFKPELFVCGMQSRHTLFSDHER